MSEREGNRAVLNPVPPTQEGIKKGPIKVTVEDIKFGGTLATILTGGGLMSFAPDGSPGKYAGGVIFLGLMGYPLVEIIKEEIKSLKEWSEPTTPDHVGCVVH